MGWRIAIAVSMTMLVFSFIGMIISLSFGQHFNVAASIFLGWCISSIVVAVLLAWAME